MRTQANEAGPATGRKRRPPKSSAGERRLVKRLEVSLPALIHVDRERAHPGVVTSISANGLFVQTDLTVPLHARVVIGFGLGGGLGRVKLSARQVHSSRRMGTEDIVGFGVEFDAPPAELPALLTELAAVQPDPIALDASGHLVWPLPPVGMGLVPPASGLCVLRDTVWKRVEIHGRDQACPTRDLLNSLRSGKGTTTIAHHGAILAPNSGLETEPLRGALSAPTDPTGLAAALTAQLQLTESLSDARWRLENLVGHEELLREHREALDEARKHFVANAMTNQMSSDDSMAVIKGLLTLVQFLDRILFCVMAGSERHRAIKKTTETKRRTADSSIGNTVLWHLGALGALVVVLGATTWYRAHKIVDRPVLPVTVEELAALLPVHDLTLNGNRAVLTVNAEWIHEKHSIRRANFVATCTLLGDRRFTEVVAQSPARRKLAQWKQRAVVIFEPEELLGPGSPPG